ncbi:hypothetical protein [Halopiger xanaduensis]|uniref:Uncharacterized protein n=1 Tax=Halopiger xanaduensis (strain DSM 18323 / JCM 14033 / SH-6) TaxID=797210 RepID=F8DE21_HALXS|nr:hypothetical protein [Halopiger xanaduensis]AEH39297.1 hypothetical protein Halxa_0044 [Halopiger xanaduensis SH-6]
MQQTIETKEVNGQTVEITRVDGEVKTATIRSDESDRYTSAASSDVGTQFVGTESLWDNMDYNKMSQILSWVSDAWNSHIEDDGDYDSWFTAQGPAGVTIPESELSNSSDLGDRLSDADEWLRDNEGDFYDGPSSIIVVDYHGDDDNTYGIGYVGRAGESSYKNALVDVHHEDNNNLPSELSEVESEGVAFHELLHIYDATHPSDVSTRSGNPDEISIMYSWDGVSCSDNGDTEQIVEWVSDCTEGSVHSYIDSNF